MEQNATDIQQIVSNKWIVEGVVAMTRQLHPETTSWQRSVKKYCRRLWADRYMYLIILPVLVYFALFKYWPMLWLRVSFYDYKVLKGFDGSKFVGLKYLEKFLSSPDFWVILGNTIVLNLYCLAFVFPVPILFALLLNELRPGRFKKFTQTISYLPYFISTIAFASMIITFLSPNEGTLATIFRMFGKEPIYFMGDAKYFRPIVVISGIWQLMGWNAIVYLSALTAIDPQLYEAAVIDGAGRWKQTWHVTLPSIRTTIVIMLILQIGNLMNVNFEKVYLLQNTANLSASEVIQTYVYKQGIVNFNYSYGSMIGMFNSVVSLLLVAGANAVSRKISEVSLW